MKHIIILVLFFLATIVVKSQQLEILVEQALRNNPEIEKLEFQYQIATEKINEVDYIPHTEFNMGFMALGPEMDMPMELFNVSVMQMLPWFGTIPAKRNYANSLAEAQRVESTIAQRKLGLAIAQYYYKLYEINVLQEVLNENIQLLETFEKLALTSLEVGKASAVDVLRLQMTQNELQQEKEVLIQQNIGLQAALNSLMNREHDELISIQAVLELPEEDSFYSYENLSVNPELIKYDKLYDAVEQSELVNQKESNPIIGFGIEYIKQENSPMITSDFKDMVMPMFSISVPLFNKKYKSITAQNDLRKQEINAQKVERLNALKGELSKAISQRNQARIKYDLQVKNLKIAKNAEKILLKNYETGTIDYDEVLKIQELQLKFQKNQVEAIKSYYEQSAIIDYITK